MVTQSQNILELIQPLLLMMVIGLLLLLLLRQMTELSRAREVYARTQRVYTVVACGDKVEVRAFREGDYVGLDLGECGDGRRARIIGIYAEEVQAEKR